MNARQVEIASEVLFNDKMNSAAQGLTSRREFTRVVKRGESDEVVKEIEDDLVARAAAIDRLEGLVSEQELAAPRVVRLLAAYVRGNFQCENVLLTDEIKLRKVPRMDLQKAVDAIGRIHKIAVDVDISHWRLDLKGCDFDGVDFSNGFFRAINFSECRFEASIFDGGIFEGCLFVGALLNYSSFNRANLRGARFDRITLNRPHSTHGGWVDSIILGDLTGATFIAADISALDYIGEPDDIAKTFATKDTIVSDEVRHQIDSIENMKRAHRLRRYRQTRKLSADDQRLVEGLERSGFQNWSPYDSSDGAIGHQLAKFYEELGMKEWPYWNS